MQSERRAHIPVQLVDLGVRNLYDLYTKTNVWLITKHAKIFKPCRQLLERRKSVARSSDLPLLPITATSSDSDTDFVAPIMSKSCPAKKLKKNLKISKVASPLDRAKLPKVLCFLLEQWHRRSV